MYSETPGTSNVCTQSWVKYTDGGLYCSPEAVQSGSATYRPVVDNTHHMNLSIKTFIKILAGTPSTFSQVR